MSAEPQPESSVRPERRVAPSIAVLVSMAMPFLLPSHYSSPIVWVLVVLEGAFLVALLAVDPGRIDRRGRQVQVLSNGLVVVIAASAAFATGRLVVDLLHGDPQTTHASELLTTGALVWIDTILAFS